MPIIRHNAIHLIPVSKADLLKSSVNYRITLWLKKKKGIQKHARDVHVVQQQKKLYTFFRKNNFIFRWKLVIIDRNTGDIWGKQKLF